MEKIVQDDISQRKRDPTQEGILNYKSHNIKEIVQIGGASTAPRRMISNKKYG